MSTPAAAYSPDGWPTELFAFGGEFAFCSVKETIPNVSELNAHEAWSEKPGKWHLQQTQVSHRENCELSCLPPGLSTGHNPIFADHQRQAEESFRLREGGLYQCHLVFYSL